MPDRHRNGRDQSVGRAQHNNMPFLTYDCPFFNRLERREEALHCHIVADIARTAHRANDAIVYHQPLELLAAVLAAAIGVMQQCIGFAPSPDRHRRRVGNELCVTAALIDQPTTRRKNRSASPERGTEYTNCRSWVRDGIKLSLDHDAESDCI